MRRLALSLLLLGVGACAREEPRRLEARAVSPKLPAPRARAKATATATASAPRLGALSSRVYVRKAPRLDSPEIGVLHLGASVRLRAGEAGGKNGCPGGWRAVEPEGWVCLDESTTLDVDSHPVLRAKRSHHGRFDEALPFRWSSSREGVLYRKLPTRREQEQTEFELARHLGHAAKLRSDPSPPRVPRALVGVDVSEASGKPPGFLLESPYSPVALGAAEDQRPLARRIPSRSTIAWTDEFVKDGRSWVLTEDLLFAPKDKLLPQAPSSFSGVRLDNEAGRLPIAFVRFEPRPKLRLVRTASDVVPASFSLASETSDGSDEASDGRDPLSGFSQDESPGALEDSGEAWPRLSSVGLTGRLRKQGRERFLETSEGKWMRERDATLVDERLPRGFALANGEKWIDVSIFKGTLVAYEGTRPVFATLISPGANGYKRVDGLPAKHTTPTGTFRIEWKHLTTTMTPDPERLSYYLSEVPHTQFFHMPFALHAAYWHDRFGEPKSGGCVNLSPKDAKWLFDWTEPRVPEGWHAVRSGDGRGPGTWVRIR